MSCGIVRKVDELGRVVIPKEMRRILNIKTGSSIEMFINEDNQVVLKKFSEMSNIFYFAENLSDILYDNFSLSCCICDEEKVLISKGLSKKEYSELFLDKSVEDIKGDYKIFDKSMKIFKERQNEFENTFVFPVVCEGFKNGYVVVFSNQKIKDDVLEKTKLLTQFLSNLLKY